MKTAYFLAIATLMFLSSGCNNVESQKTAQHANTQSKHVQKEPDKSPADIKLSNSTENSGNLVNFNSLHWGLGRGHKTDAFLSVAISLQKLGRDEACNELMKFAKTEQPKSHLIDDSFMALCRMLFVARSGKEFRRPMVGAPNFFGGTDIADWPLEPIEIVDGVPFIITSGYNLAGFPEPPQMYLEYCMKECDWNSFQYTMLTEQQKQASLKQIIASKKWKRPLDESEQEFLSEQIQ